MPSRKKSLILNGAGFTLLEIIAVMVIMSILAVVAVPKYFDLQTQARQKAMDTAMAEAVGRVNSYFAQKVLGGATPDTIDYATNSPIGTDMGDFELATVDGQHFDTTPVGGTSPTPPDCSTSVSGTRGCIYLTVTPKSTTTALSGTGSVSKSIPRPGNF